VTAVSFASELDRAAPQFEFRERHSLRMRATPEGIRAAIKAVTADEIFLFHALMRIRQLGRPLPPNISGIPRETPLHEIATRTHFAVLADEDRELVTATVVARPKGSMRPTTAADILAARSRAGYAVATMNWTIAPRGDGTCLVTTETRVHAADAATRWRFAAYWLVIRAGSGFIRRMWLRAIRKRAEAA
jgi:hypothetical protein